MSLTKVTNSMISGAVANVFDYMTPAQISDVQSNAATLDVTAPIQAALAVAMHVYMPTGTYRITAPLQINAFDGQVLSGDGIFATVIKKVFNGQAIPVTRPRTTLSDFAITGYSYTGDGIHVLANACAMQNIYVAGCTRGFRIGSDASGNNSNSWNMLNCSAVSNTSHGVYCHDVDDNANAGTATNLTLLQNGGDGLRIGLCQVNTWVGVLAEGNVGWGCLVSPPAPTQTVQTFIGGDYEANGAGDFKLDTTAFLNYVQVMNALGGTVVVDFGVANTIVTPGQIFVPELVAASATIVGENSTTPTIQRISHSNTFVNNRNYAWELSKNAYGDFGLYQSLVANGNAGAANSIPKLLWDINSGPGLRMTLNTPSNADGANGDICFCTNGGALTTIYQKRAGVWVGIV
jgi:hypothetical protein